MTRRRLVLPVLAFAALTLALVPSAGAWSHRILVITIAPGSLPAGTTGTAYSQTVTASGGTAPYTYARTVGSLPPGLSLSSGGVISGTPTSSGNYSFTITATDSLSATGSQAYSVSISPAAVDMTPTSLPPASRSVFYSTSLTGTGGTSPYTFAVTGGVLPAGVSMSSTGVLSGTPGATGSFSFTVTATDTNSSTGSRAYVLNVNTATLDIAPGSLANGAPGVQYVTMLTGSGGTPPYTFSLSAGTLPPGLNLASNGALTGTPSQVGSSAFTVRLTDGAAQTVTRAYNFTVTVNALSISGLPPDGTYAVQYINAFSGGSGTAPYTFALAGGTLPPGLTLGSDGKLSGMPLNYGTYNFTLTATDKYGATGTYPFVLIIKLPTLVMTPNELFPANAPIPYSATLSTAGGLAPYVYTLDSGQLPAGITLSTRGVLSGVPSGPPGLYTFSVRMTDAYAFTNAKTFTLQVSAPTLLVTSLALPAATAGSPYLQKLGATGGTEPYTFSLAQGVLPSGMSLLPDGTLSGTPANAGTFLLSVKVSDANGVSITQTLRLVVEKKPPTVTKKKPTAPKKKKAKHR